MKYKALYISLLSCALFACKSKEETNSEQMSKTVKKFMEDKAFKENLKLNIMEFKFLEYDTLNENTLDSLRISANLDKIEANNREMEFANKRMSLELQSMRLYGELDRKGSLFLNSKEKMATLGEEFKSLQDSSKKFFHIDSMINNQINSRKKPNLVFQAKVFVKGSAEDTKKQSSNILDTMYFYFNKDLILQEN